MAFRSGAEAAEEAAARSSFHRVEFFSLDDGAYGNYRFITDEKGWLTVDQHVSIPTRPAPADYKGKWPPKMGAVCRMEQGLEGAFSECFICDHVQIDGKPAPRKQRTWALAVKRDEVYDGGRMVGLKDATEEIEIDGKKITIPKFIVFNQAWNMIWSNFSAHLQMHGTVLDRDFRISRKGKELATDYSIAPFDPITVEENGQQVRWDLREERFMAPYKEAMKVAGIDLVEIIKERASDDFYAQFFDVRVPQPKRNAKDDKGGSGEVPDAPSGDAPSAEELAALAARAENYGPTPGSTGSIQFG